MTFEIPLITLVPLFQLTPPQYCFRLLLIGKHIDLIAYYCSPRSILQYRFVHVEGMIELLYKTSNWMNMVSITALYTVYFFIFYKNNHINYVIRIWETIGCILTVVDMFYPALQKYQGFLKAWPSPINDDGTPLVGQHHHPGAQQLGRRGGTGGGPWGVDGSGAVG